MSFSEQMENLKMMVWLYCGIEHRIEEKELFILIKIFKYIFEF